MPKSVPSFEGGRANAWKIKATDIEAKMNEDNVYNNNRNLPRDIATPEEGSLTMITGEKQHKSTWEMRTSYLCRRGQDAKKRNTIEIRYPYNITEKILQKN